MPTVNEIIRRLLPNGSNRASRGVRSYPVWPPDAFAVAATFVNLSGIYCMPRYARGHGPGFFSNPTLKRIKRTAAAWGLFLEERRSRRSHINISNIRHLHKLWAMILANGDCQLQSMPTECADTCITLMMIADEASAGMGFVMNVSGKRPFADYLLQEHENYFNERATDALPYFPESLCRMIPSGEVCVQPKTMTPQLGCTLRSWSHHLALLPAATQVTTEWCIAENQFDFGSHDRALNLLLVPFPYRIEELALPAGHHALLITLTHAQETNYTLDGRSDDGETYRLWLSGVRSVRHANPPKWVAAD